jgi:hypothetical protein
VRKKGLMKGTGNKKHMCQSGPAGSHAAFKKSPRALLGFVLAAVFALPAASALAQDIGGGGGGNPLAPKLSIGGEQKRKLTPEEEERQKRIDADYKAATSKIPDQKARDPWADVRQAPTTADAKKKQH